MVQAPGPSARALAEVLREGREARGLSLRQLAQRLGYSTHSELSAYERGDRVLPASRVATVADLLNIDPDLLEYLRQAAAAERAGRSERSVRIEHVLVGSALRPRPPRFVGRERLLGELAAALSSRTVTFLVGEAGIGCREVAAEFMARHAARFNRVEWRRTALEFANAETVESTLVVVEGASPGSALSQLAERVGAANGRVLATASMSPEPPLPIVLSPLDESDSVALVRVRCGESGESSASALAEACGRVPLNVELASAAAHQLGIDPRRLAQRLGHATVAALVRFALDHLRELSPPAAVLLERLAAEPADSFGREVLAEDDGSVPDILRRAVAEELPLLDAVALLNRWALVRPASNHLWTHALVREAVRQASAS